MIGGTGPRALPAALRVAEGAGLMRRPLRGTPPSGRERLRRNGHARWPGTWRPDRPGDNSAGLAT
jgi:hypothetical protein